MAARRPRTRTPRSHWEKGYIWTSASTATATVCSKGGTFVLGARYQDALPALLTERTDLAPEYIGAVLRTWTNGMAAFRPTEITDSELEALIAYLTRNNE